MLQVLGPSILNEFHLWEKTQKFIDHCHNTKSNDPGNNVVQVSDLEKQLHDQKDEIAKLQAKVAQLKTKQIPNNSVSNIRPKINLCQNYMMGNCQFAEYCQYAHGLRDLQNPFYKTKMCKNLPNCIYGDNCINAHSKVVMN